MPAFGFTEVHPASVSQVKPLSNTSPFELESKTVEEALMEINAKASISNHSKKLCRRVAFPFTKAVERIQSMRDYVILYFMGQVMTETTFKEWAEHATGSTSSFSDVTFVGKGFYMARCSSFNVKCRLLDDVHFGPRLLSVDVMPWTPYFDDSLSILPVWVTFKGLPKWLHADVSLLAEELGKVLYVSKSRGHVIGTLDARVCVLWDKNNDVPECLDVDMGPCGVYRQLVKFSPLVESCRSMEHSKYDTTESYNVSGANETKAKCDGLSHKSSDETNMKCNGVRDKTSHETSMKFNGCQSPSKPVISDHSNLKVFPQGEEVERSDNSKAMDRLPSQQAENNERSDSLMERLPSQHVENMERSDCSKAMDRLANHREEGWNLTSSDETNAETNVCGSTLKSHQEENFPEPSGHITTEEPPSNIQEEGCRFPAKEVQVETAQNCGSTVTACKQEELGKSSSSLLTVELPSTTNIQGFSLFSNAQKVNDCGSKITLNSDNPSTVEQSLSNIQKGDCLSPISRKVEADQNCSSIVSSCKQGEQEKISAILSRVEQCAITSIPEVETGECGSKTAVNCVNCSTVEHPSSCVQLSTNQMNVEANGCDSKISVDSANHGELSMNMEKGISMLSTNQGKIEANVCNFKVSSSKHLQQEKADEIRTSFSSFYPDPVLYEIAENFRFCQMTERKNVNCKQPPPPGNYDTVEVISVNTKNRKRIINRRKCKGR